MVLNSHKKNNISILLKKEDFWSERKYISGESYVFCVILKTIVVRQLAIGYGFIMKLMISRKLVDSFT